MIAFDRQEALRYLGYRNTEPDAAVADSLARCAAELQAAVQPKSVFAAFPLSHPAENTLEIAGVTIRSENLSRNLKGCEQVYLMAATLGIAADRLIARASAVRGKRHHPAGGGEGRLVLPPAVQPGLRGF